MEEIFSKNKYVYCIDSIFILTKYICLSISFFVNRINFKQKGAGSIYYTDSKRLVFFL